MWTHSRQFEDKGDDIKKMCKLIIQQNADADLVFDWSLGRVVSWRYGLWNEKKQDIAFLETTARLWFDYFDELVGFAISESGDNAYSLALKDEYEPCTYADLCHQVSN